jgi:hypothetical protein
MDSNYNQCSTKFEALFGKILADKNRVTGPIKCVSYSDYFECKLISVNLIYYNLWYFSLLLLAFTSR